MESSLLQPELQIEQNGQLGLFAQAVQSEVNKETFNVNSKLITDSDDFAIMIDELKKQSVISLRVFADVKNALNSQIYGIALGYNKAFAFDDRDNSASDGIKKVREKYPDDELVFANGGDRTKDNIPESSICKELNVRLEVGVGGSNKANASSKILKEYEAKLTNK